MNYLWQIDAPYFCAGITSNTKVVTGAAPIIRWMIGKSFTEIVDYCRGKNWKLNPVGVF